MGFESTLECARWQARSARSHRSKLVFLRRGETKERRFQQRATVASVLISLLLFVACSDSPTQPTRLAEATPSAESASGPSLTGADVTATAGTSHPLLPPTPDHSSSTPPPPGPSNPRTRFGPGQHRVGRDIRPRRYFSDPRRGCFWERLSGFGGTISDTIANEFIGFDAGQWIVDIKASDVGFSTDDDCGTWFPGKRTGMKPTVTPGMWLVGAQITPGTYRSTVRSGCFRQRLRSFTGRTSESTIANDFVGTGGPRMVTIKSTDKGFESDEDCGTWRRVSGAAAVVDELLMSDQSPAVMLDNWMNNRRQSGR